MAIPLCKLEGTWEEIMARVPNFSGRKLEMVVFPAEEATTETAVQAADDPLVAVLCEIEERSRFMNPQPASRDYLREARSGAMFGVTADE